MAEERDLVQFLELQKPVTLTLTLDRVVQHTIVHQSSTYLHTKFQWNRKNLLWTDGRTYWRTFQTPSNVISSTWSWPNNYKMHWVHIFHCRFRTAVNLLRPRLQRFTEFMPLPLVQTMSQCLWFYRYNAFHKETRILLKRHNKWYSASSY